MAYDTMLYRATITHGATVNLNQIVGPSTIRTGYGNAKLVSVQAFVHSTNAADTPKIQVEYKNNNWVRSNKLWAGLFGDAAAHARNTFNYVYGHGYKLQTNSTFIVSAKSIDTSAYSGTVTVDVLITVDYDSIKAINPDNYEGCPVCFELTQPSGVTGNAGDQVRLGSYDPLDPAVSYCINEISSSNVQGMMYVIIGGLQPQQGLVRVLPVPPVGAKIVPTVLGSVAFTKQSFDVYVLSDIAISSQIIPIYMELLASTNSM